MAKTLVIKGADFSATALEQIEWESVICTGITLSPKTITVSEIGSTSTIIATITPSECTQPIIWATSDSSVATVSNGTITAVGNGTATITATCGSQSDTATVTVSEQVIECTGITLSESSVAIVTTGNTSTVIATITPEDCTQPVVWTTSNIDVATVINGVITATGLGTATITATCGNYSSTVTVAVTEFMNKQNLLKMSGVYVNPNEAASTGGNGLTVIYTSTTYKNRGVLASSTGEKYCNEYGNGYFYPYIMPKGTKRIKITDTGSTGIKKQDILWYNSQAGNATLPDYVNLIGDTNIISINTNPYILDIPTYEGYPNIDSMIILFRTYKTGTTFVDADFDDITIEFLPAE